MAPARGGASSRICDRGFFALRIYDRTCREFHNVAKEHNRHVAPPLAFAAVVANVSSHGSLDTNPAQTTSYTALVQVSPGVAYLACLLRANTCSRRNHSSLTPRVCQCWTTYSRYDLLRVGCPLGKTERWCQQHGLGCKHTSKTASFACAQHEAFSEVACDYRRWRD